MRPRFSLAFILLLMFNLSVARAAAASLAPPATLGGSYLLDQRPQALMLLTLTQDGTTLGGSMLTATADGQGGTVNTISALSGSIADGAFTLTASQQAGGLALAGRFKNGSAEVSFTNKAGQTLTLPLYRASQAQFNRYLGAWTRHMAKEHATVNKAAPPPSPPPTPKPSIPDEVQVAEAALADAKRALLALGKSLDSLKREVAAKPANCQQAQGGLDAIYAKDMNPAYKNDFGGSIGALRRAVMHLHKLLASAEDNKATRKAREAINGWKSQENALVAEANGIMREAKSIVAGASCG